MTAFRLTAFFILSFCSAAVAEPRVALIIGNGAYRNVQKLPNPPNDASSIGDALTRLNFKVTRVIDGDASQMRQALLDFSKAAEGSEFSLVFYAGHGVERLGENWLIPTDARLATEGDVEQEAIRLGALMFLVGKASKLGLVVLDSCRNDPFDTQTAGVAKTRAVSRGLAPIEPNDNVLVFYAAKAGTVASDGTGAHSPFTTALLNNIELPGLEVNFLMRRARDEVMAATQRTQQPFWYGSLSQDFVFLKPSKDGPPPIATASADSTVQIPTPSTSSNRSNAEFIFSDSDRKLLSASDLRSLSREDLRIARNEIFARKGRKFQSADLNQRFSRFAWYRPSNVEPELNSIETDNVALIKRAEDGNTGQGQFVFEDSDRRQLSFSELNRLSKDELRIARNEIFARRGRYFKSADLTARFSQYAWYVPTTWDPPLNPTEKANIALMDQIENSR